MRNYKALEQEADIEDVSNAPSPAFLSLYQFKEPQRTFISQAKWWSIITSAKLDSGVIKTQESSWKQPINEKHAHGKTNTLFAWSIVHNNSPSENTSIVQNLHTKLHSVPSGTKIKTILAVLQIYGWLFGRFLLGILQVGGRGSPVITFRLFTVRFSIFQNRRVKFRVEKSTKEFFLPKKSTKSRP